MAVNFGFYNSLAGDRVYDATTMSSILKGVVVDGVLKDVGSKLFTVAYSGMIVKVGSGKCWFNDTWTENTTDLQLTVATAHPTLPRIDTVILEVDTSLGVRANDIKILAGTPASSPVAPTLTNNSTLHQYPLADIAVGAGVTVINSGNITVRVDTVDTPYASITNDSYLQGQIDSILVTLAIKPIYKVRGWVSNPQTVYVSRAQIPIIRSEAAITVTRAHIHCSDTTPGAELAGDLKFADDLNVGGFANATVIHAMDTTGGVKTVTSGFTDPTIPSGKYVYYQMDSSPHVDIKDFYLEFFYTVD